MKTKFTRFEQLPRALFASVLSSFLMLVAALPGCGGVGSGGTGNGAATSFTSGPITGFGSVIVNGVRYDDTAAQVQDGDGVSRSRDDLRLGMTVEIDGGAVSITTTTSTAKASSIRYDSDLLGAVGSINVAVSTLTVLGQTVLTDAATVFDPAVGSLAALRTNALVEVFAVFDPASLRYRATRVGPATSAAVPHVRGLVAQVDAATQTLKIANTNYGYAGAAGIPSDLAAGQFVRLRVAAGAPSSGRYTVLGFGTALRGLPDSDGASLKGVVTAFTSMSNFSVNGRPVDASSASFPNGSAGLRVGARAEVEGSVSRGVLVAKKVNLVTEDGGNNQTFEISGPITSVNAADKSFVLRGLTIGTGRSDLRYQDGTAANLVVGRSVEVKGKLSADGLRIDAFNIKFE
jgi:Domain of unknown function (DUF5666)